ncbi:endonuclease/exonuclease/phosphatase family protein [Thioflexithrix psekupsensis]|uniref:Endonuclease/exonuclease/phosphatase domain-containing protein n=1 Tax=Thioflexithrix psekupsensis TaxID=1570016 RepID=A0A251X625_9GAMM|nr:endonuclease/exonuclease/phosphatase family protein [Thioflexithrix psekupsensis]OUD13088.1 hypothetical protein TPSD3_10590 [Thioflexithrix psekupsensis]
MNTFFLRGLIKNIQVTTWVLWRFFIWLGIVTLIFGLIGQWVRDIYLIFSFFSYIPLLPIALLFLLLDILWRGRLFSRLRFVVSFIAIVAIFTHLHYLKGWENFQAVEKQPQSIILIHWNVLWGTWQHWEAIAQRIQTENPDIIVISEPPSIWDLGQLKKQLGNNKQEWYLLSRWPLVILSKYPIDVKEKILFTNGIGVLVELTIADKIMRLLMIDGKRDLWQSRDYLLGDIYRYLLENQPIHLIVGDFNALGNSRGFDAWSTLNYQLAARTAGQWRGTWPSGFPLYDIDHVWLHEELQLEQLHFLYHPATDHRGQSVQFSWEKRDF